MNKEDIIRMARQAGFERLGHDEHDYVCYPDDIVAFAALVAKHKLLNTDPSSFMSWQEGYEAGKQTEREACWNIIFEYAGRDDLTLEEESLLKHLADLIRARGEQA